MKLDLEKLKIAMAEKEVNFSRLADLAGVSKQTVSYIKNGKSCGTDVAGKLAHALGVSVKDILEEA